MKSVIVGAKAVATFATAAIAVVTHRTFGRPQRVDNGPHMSCRSEYATACAVTDRPAASTVESSSSAITGTSGRMIVRSRQDQKMMNGRRKAGAPSRRPRAAAFPATSGTRLATSRRGGEVGLRVTDARERIVVGEVAAAAGDQEVLRRERRDDHSAVRRQAALHV